MTGRIFLCYLLFLINAIPLASQKEYLLQADHAFENGQYQKAIRLYTQYNKIDRDKDALGKRGISHFNYNLVDKAIADFTAAKNLGNNDPILYLKMGQSKQFLKAFDEASFFYQKYLELTDENAPYRKMAELEIKNCVFGALETFETAGTLIQSFGDDVNSRYDEIYPIQSPTYGNVFYFSSNRNKSNFDILSYTLSESGLWSKNDLTEKPFNNAYHNVALDVDAANINAMLYSEVDMGQETIQFASFDLSGQDIVVKLPTEIFEGAKDISIVNHNMLVFSSKKLNGFGGYDIFTVSYKDGAWTTPQNLGAAINSPFDEICPFYSNNLDHFYFSSNRPYCFGGYDVYYCDIVNKKLPVNMGYGINSHGDDLHFNIDDAGHMATFSSNRKTGLGGYDLFFAYLQDIKNMGQKDSLVFEYLINPAEEFVQVKSKDDLVALNSNNNSLNSSSDSNAIEINTKLEPVKERSEETIPNKTDVIKQADNAKNETVSITEENQKSESSEKADADNITEKNTDKLNSSNNTFVENSSNTNDDLVSKTRTKITVKKEEAIEVIDEDIDLQKTDVAQKSEKEIAENINGTTEKSLNEDKGQDSKIANKNAPIKNKYATEKILANEEKTKEEIKIKTDDSSHLSKDSKPESKPTIDTPIAEVLNNNEGSKVTDNKSDNTKEKLPVTESLQKSDSTSNISDKANNVDAFEIVEEYTTEKKETTSIQEGTNKNVKATKNRNNIPTNTSDEDRTSIELNDNSNKNEVPVRVTEINKNDSAVETKIIKDKTIEGDSKVAIEEVKKTTNTSTNNKVLDKQIDVQQESEKSKSQIADKEKPKTILSKSENLKEEKTEGLVKSRDFKKIEKSWTTFAQPQTLYYQDRQDLIRGENMVKLNQLIVGEYESNTEFVLLAHTDDSELGLPEYVQYNTFKRALKVAEYLEASGIAKSRIRIESLANNYPLIKSDIAGEKVNSLYAYNKRVDVLLYNNNNIQEDNVIADTTIPEYAFDRRYELFRSIREGTYYSIEIASAERIFKNAILRLYNDIYIRRDDLEGKNKYYIGIYTQKEDAEELSEQLLETSSPYAKVVKFINGIVVE